MDRSNAAIRLFVPDLPETTDAMIAGGVYAMIAETPPARFALLASSMAGAVAGNIVTTLVLPSSPKLFIDRLTQVGFPGAEDAIETGHLQVFQLQDDFSKKMFRFGAEAFINELDHFQLPAQSYLVIDQADELLSLHDISLAIEQAEALGQWARKLKVTILLMFTRVAAVSASLATLTGLMDYLSGLARLGGHQDGLDLTFEYWQSPDGTVAAKMYQLIIRDDGRYQVKKQEAAPEVVAPVGGAPVDALEPEEPAAELRYLYIDPALAGLAKQMVGQWQACDSMGGVIRAAFGARAPTVLLSFERTSVLRELAESVHTLRLSLGRRARIVVVEREASLRYQNEILLLRLGTSLVVHRDVQENRIPLMLESLRGQIFNRDIEMNFDAALSSVVTSAKRGYLPPASFVRETASIVDRSDLLNLPCALVVAKPDSTRACTELLTRVRVTRAGDLTSTDGKLCFIFFSGCPESSLKRALQAVLGADLEHLFTDMQFFVQRPDISKRLKALGQDTQGKTFPDTIVQAITPKAVEAKPEPAATQPPAPAAVAQPDAATVLAAPRPALPPPPPSSPPSQATRTPTITAISSAWEGWAAETVVTVPPIIVAAPPAKPVVDFDFGADAVPAAPAIPATLVAQAVAPAPATPQLEPDVPAPDLAFEEDAAPLAAQPPVQEAWPVTPSHQEPVTEPKVKETAAAAPVVTETPAPLARPATPQPGVLNRLFSKSSSEARATRAVPLPAAPAAAPLAPPPPPATPAPTPAPTAAPTPPPAPAPQADPPHVFGRPTSSPVPAPARALRRAVRVSAADTDAAADQASGVQQHG